MDTYVTGTMIKTLREARGITQQQLADQIGISSKAISKWENARGLPDISLIEPLAAALGVSVVELMNGQVITNRNAAGNLLRARFYVCPICGNVIHAMGEAVISCCGITLPALESEELDEQHTMALEKVEDEHFVTVDHEMTKAHFISFLAFVTGRAMAVPWAQARQKSWAGHTPHFGSPLGTQTVAPSSIIAWLKIRISSAFSGITA